MSHETLINPKRSQLFTDRRKLSTQQITLKEASLEVRKALVKQLQKSFALIHKVTVVKTEDPRNRTLYFQLQEQLAEFNTTSNPTWVFCIYFEKHIAQLIQKLQLKALECSFPLKCCQCEKNIHSLPLVQKCYHSFHVDCIKIDQEGKRECPLCVTKCYYCPTIIKSSYDPNALVFVKNYKVAHKECAELKSKQILLSESFHPLTLTLFRLNGHIKSLYNRYQDNLETIQAMNFATLDVAERLTIELVELRKLMQEEETKIKKEAEKEKKENELKGIKETDEQRKKEEVSQNVKGNHEEMSVECGTCWKEITKETDKNSLVLSRCFHLFHSDCIKKYKDACEDVISCPNCREIF